MVANQADFLTSAKAVVQMHGAAAGHHKNRIHSQRFQLLNQIIRCFNHKSNFSAAAVTKKRFLKKHPLICAAGSYPLK